MLRESPATIVARRATILRTAPPRRMEHLVPLDKAKDVEMARAFHHLHLTVDVSTMFRPRKLKKPRKLCWVRSLSTPFPHKSYLIPVPPIVSQLETLLKEST